MVFSSIVHWIRIKYYQYEVTMPVYILNPTEKIIFNSFVLLILGMVFIASYLYLPDHIATVTRRATFYFFGNDGVPGVVSRAGPIAEGISETLRAKAEL